MSVSNPTGITAGIFPSQVSRHPHRNGRYFGCKCPDLHLVRPDRGRPAAAYRVHIHRVIGGLCLKVWQRCACLPPAVQIFHGMHMYHTYLCQEFVKAPSVPPLIINSQNTLFFSHSRKNQLFSIFLLLPCTAIKISRLRHKTRYNLTYAGFLSRKRHSNVLLLKRTICSKSCP